MTRAELDLQHRIEYAKNKIVELQQIIDDAKSKQQVFKKFIATQGSENARTDTVQLV